MIFVSHRSSNRKENRHDEATPHPQNPPQDRPTHRTQPARLSLHSRLGDEDQVRRALLIAIASLAIISPAHAGEVTPTERAAEECEDPIQLADFGNGDFDTCYVNMLDEINTYNAIHGTLTEDQPMERTPIQEDEPGWDCHTMGNKICGPTPTPTPLNELPRTQ